MGRTAVLGRTAWVAALAAAAALLAGCGHPLIPAGALAVPTAGPVSPTSVPSPAVIDTVRRPVLGVDLYSVGSPLLRVARGEGRRDLAYIVHTLHADSVGIAWNFYTPDDHSNRVEHTNGTLSPWDVAALTREAQADHLTVEYRPLLKVQRGSQWSGYVSPPDQAAWFASYYRAELPYLRVARRLHVREFVTSTELVALNTASQWPGFLARVRRVFHGVVSYAADRADYLAPANRLLLPVRLYGTTAYPDSNLPDSASAGQLAAFWERVYGRVPEPILSKTMIDEIGIPAQAGAYAEPWAWRRVAPLDETVQARWFTAACTAVEALHMRGLYFWNVNLADDPAYPPFPSPTTFEGKRGAAAIGRCARIFHRSPRRQQVAAP